MGKGTSFTPTNSYYLSICLILPFICYRYDHEQNCKGYVITTGINTVSLKYIITLSRHDHIPRSGKYIIVQYLINDTLSNYRRDLWYKESSLSKDQKI